MLYDPQKWEPKTDLSKPSLRALAYLLRHQELWPAGFEWDFKDCDKCAMGLAFQLWQLGELPDGYAMTQYFPLSECEVLNLFCMGNMGNARVITPEDIADRIDAHTEGVG